MPPQKRRVAVLVAVTFAVSIFAHSAALATEPEPYDPIDAPASIAPSTDLTEPEAPVRDAGLAAIDEVIEMVNSLPPPPTLAYPAPASIEVIGVSEPGLGAIDLTQPKSDLWDRVRNGFAIPNLDNQLVQARQSWLAERPDQVRILVDRGRRYLYHIVEALEARSMPMELALLPMVESAMNPMAYSRAAASGLWQFIPSTGKQYNLPQNWWFDARRDIVASTKSALDYLQFLYEMHGDWHLALASYNWGENAVARAIERNRERGLPTDYQSLAMPNETRHYIPRLQALKNIILNPQMFGVDLQPIPNQPYFVTVELTRDIDMKLAARLAETSVEELVALNPGHNRPVVSARSAARLVVPTDRLDTFVRNVAAYDKPLTSWKTYSAQRGERVDRIAAAHGMSADAFRLVNGIQGNGRLRADAQLIVPARGGAEIVPGLFRGPAMIAAEPDRVARAYVVRKGDSWASIAGRFRVSVGELRGWNPNANLNSGQRLTVHVVPGIVAPAKGKAPVRKNSGRVLARR